MYHLRLKGTHYEIGVRRGNVFKKCGITFPLMMDDYQLKHGIESEKILRKYFEEVCEEVKGITDTIGADYTKFISWMLAMGCCMYNLDCNIPIEVRGCTAFGVIKDNEIYYGRNNDLPPYLKKGSKSEIYKLNDRVKFNITTSSFINGEEGINEYGLAVAMTFVNTKLEDIRPGLNSVFIVRYLLEKAKNVKEAEKLLLDLPVSSNCNIILIDRNKDMEVIECSPMKKYIREAITLFNGIKIVCTVNSFTSDVLKEYEFKELDTYNSNERYNTVISSFDKYNDEDILEYIKKILKGDLGFICQYKKEENFETVWSSIFNINTLEINRCEDDPRRNSFIKDVRLQKH